MTLSEIGPTRLTKSDDWTEVQLEGKLGDIKFVGLEIYIVTLSTSYFDRLRRGIINCVIARHGHANGPDTYFSLLPMWSLFLSLSLSLSIFFSLFSSPLGEGDAAVLLDSDAWLVVFSAWWPVSLSIYCSVNVSKVALRTLYGSSIPSLLRIGSAYSLVIHLRVRVISLAVVDSVLNLWCGALVEKLLNRSTNSWLGFGGV